MSMKSAWMTLLLAICGVAFVGVSGCDTLPDPPRTAEGAPVKVESINPEDDAELAAVKAVETARADYQYRLEVLRDYYYKVGNHDKYVSAQKELKNLRNAQTFRWLGFEAVPPKGESLENVDEQLLVENALGARTAWVNAVEELAQFYKRKGATFKARLVENMQQRFEPVHRYTFFLNAEIPGPELRPTEVIPEADSLYEQAQKLYKEGKGGLHFFVSTDYNKQRQALVLFREVIDRYPNSTKIALSAYFIAEIYKEYFNENTRSVKWYQRAWEWDKNITEPARFQAATVYDLRLQDPKRAIECYKASLKYDPWRLLNREFAQDRIKKLSGQ